MHQSSYDKMLDFKNRYLNDKINKSLRVLDLGSQDVNGTYKDIFSEPLWEYQGMDMDQGKNVDIVLENPYSWKEIRSNSVDVLISGQALEHVEFFWITMLEIARILKPGGFCCIIAPSSGHEHRFPVDCWRFYCDGFKALSRFALLQEIKVYKQEEPDPKYTDSSNLWLDTVLICKKGKHSWLMAMRHRIWRFLVHKLCVKGV
ncbi:MAG: methyltransferase domain-containing protein [Desulfobacteraceae bacterium]|nr:methyltransferase domain-containing protein [Desulfobacteraceae bacterium]